MKTEIKDISPTKKKIEIEIKAEDLDLFCVQALKELIKDLELPGFRKGMVPESIAKDKISENSILGYAAELAVNQKWGEYLKQTDLEIVSQPVIEVVKLAKGNPFVFSAEVEVLIETKLPDYKAIAKTIKKEEIVIEEKEINDALAWLQQSRASVKDKEGKIEKGDFVEITLIDKENKEQKDGFLIGKGHFIKGLDEALEGAVAGDEKQIEEYKVRVDSVKKVELPELNDDLAKILGQFDNLEALKKNIKEGITQEKQIALTQKQRAEVLEKIASKAKIEIPQCLIQREAVGLLNNLENRVKNELNISFEEYLIQTKKTIEQVTKEFEKIGEDRVRNFLIIRQIIKNEDIKVSEEDINKRMEEVLASYPKKEEIDLERVKLYIEDELKTEKVFELLGF